MSHAGYFSLYFREQYDSNDDDDAYDDVCDVPWGVSVQVLPLPSADTHCKACIVLAGHTEMNDVCTCTWNEGIREPHANCKVSIYEQQFPLRMENHRWQALRQKYSIIV